jgi:bifunctional non-homologous end joining protein LigD
VLSRVHWVRPELVAEVKFLTWTDEDLLRQVGYERLREDKPASEVRRPVPCPKPDPPKRNPFPDRRQRSKRLPVPADNILQLLPDAIVQSRQELAAYWETVAADALRYLGHRPLKLVRHVKGTTFFAPSFSGPGTSFFEARFGFIATQGIGRSG